MVHAAAPVRRVQAVGMVGMLTPHAWQGQDGEKQQLEHIPDVHTDEADCIFIGSTTSTAKAPTAAATIALISAHAALATAPTAAAAIAPASCRIILPILQSSVPCVAEAGIAPSSLYGPVSALADVGLAAPALFALNRADQFWWHELIHAGLRQRIAAEGDIVWRMPLRNQDPLSHCFAVIARLDDVAYYVGITESPVARWQDHNFKGYVCMRLLFVAESSHITAGLERAILERLAYRSLRCENASYGGEGASRGSPHFLYVVTRQNSLLRRTFGTAKRSRFSSTVAEDIALWR